MFRRVAILVIGIMVYSISYGQLFYKNEIDSRNGIKIEYKVNNSKFFDKNSSAVLSFKLKNTNDYDISLKIEVEYSTGFTTSYTSGDLEICIPAKMTRRGKNRGLAFELNTNDKNIFLSDDAEWEFVKFDVKQIEKCDSKTE